MSSLKGKKVAILLERDYQDQELWYPYYRLIEEGAIVKLVAPEKKQYPSKFGYPAAADQTFQDADPESFDAVVIPGGFAPDFLRRYPSSITFTKAAHQKGALIAAICHGPWILASANLLKNKKATCFWAIADDVKNAGAHYQDSEVVEDANIITSRKPEDLPAFCRAIIKKLNSRGSKNGPDILHREPKFKPASRANIKFFAASLTKGRKKNSMKAQTAKLNRIPTGNTRTASKRRQR